LRNEFLLYGITIHCYFPGTIFTPGLEAENQIKPQLTKDIEGPEEGRTPEVLARALVKGKYASKPGLRAAEYGSQG
jgi:3-dehydrosphinganine reductase